MWDAVSKNVFCKVYKFMSTKVLLSLSLIAALVGFGSAASLVKPTVALTNASAGCPCGECEVGCDCCSEAECSCADCVCTGCASGTCPANSAASASTASLVLIQKTSDDSASSACGSGCCAAAAKAVAEETAESSVAAK